MASRTTAHSETLHSGWCESRILDQISKQITTFFQLFADFSRSYPLIPSIYKDIYHLAQWIINPLILVLWLVENLSNILSKKTNI